jgi:hypothetical protein
VPAAAGGERSHGLEFITSTKQINADHVVLALPSLRSGYRCAAEITGG